jgi:signal transduction histidine kinase
MTERTRILLFSIGIMAAASLSTAVIAVYALYQAGLEVHRARLSEVVQSRARIIEAIARFDARYSTEDVPGGATAATLSQIVEAHENFKGFGETGEFTLARRDGDQIVWLLRHRYEDAETSAPLPFAAGLAEPMSRALRGESGTMVGLDYRGVEVLAAHEKVDGLDWGVVAKIDMAEIRAPLIRTGLLVAGMALFAVAIGVGLILRITSPLIRRIEARTQELQEAHEHLRIHSSRVSLEVERARRRLAVDLHDGLGQLLALAKIKLGMLREKAEVDRLGPQLQEIESLIVGAHQQSKELTWRLGPPVLYEVGLMAALRWLAKDLEGRYGLRVTVEEQGECRQLDEETRISLFRSVNEALVNVAKHAETKTAVVRVGERNGSLEITVEDQGVGFDPSAVTSEYGLFSIRERLHYLGGILTIASARGKGTRISLVAPVETADSGTHRESV